MFTIGDFSKLCFISARMLRHYDSIGLVKPIKVDSMNGYRYYDSSQLDDIHKIEKLKHYGFTLSEIRSLLPLSEKQLEIQIAKRYESMKQQIQQMEYILRQMEADLHKKQEEITMVQNNYDVIIMENPAQRVLGLKRTINITAEDIHRLLSDLKEEMKCKGLNQSGPIQLVYLANEFSHEHMEVEAQIQVSGSHEDIKVIPAHTCIATTHHGPMRNIHHAYEAICRWLDKHPNYQMSGSSIERYIQSEPMVSSEEELVTGVLFPVTKN